MLSNDVQFVPNHQNKDIYPLAFRFSHAYQGANHPGGIAGGYRTVPVRTGKTRSQKGRADRDLRRGARTDRSHRSLKPRKQTKPLREMMRRIILFESKNGKYARSKSATASGLRRHLVGNRSTVIPQHVARASRRSRSFQRVYVIGGLQLPTDTWPFPATDYIQKEILEFSQDLLLISSVPSQCPFLGRYVRW